MEDKYRVALATFSDGADLAYQRSDALVRGQDRRPTDLFDTVVDLVAEKRTETIRRTNAELARKEQWSRWCSVSAAATAMLVLLLAMSKWITKPINAAILQARSIADGDLDIRIEEGSISELHNLQHALNSMATQIKASQASIEASNRELVKARDHAIESSNLKSQFLTNMSHEIRTPLNGVIGMTSLLLVGTLSDEQREHAQMVHTSGEILLKLINDILDFSKIEAGKLDLEILDFSLPALLHELGELLAPRARDKGLRFSQVDASTTRNYGGSGLGLAISKQLVELMNGEMGVSSVVGQGSEFWFAVCFATGTHAISAAPPPEPPPAPPAPMHGYWPALRVLVAEDNLINQKVALGFLQPFGLQVDVVVNGAQAIQALASQPYELVLMDIQMPEMGGLVATRLIRGAFSAVLNPRVPIIAMTANAMQSDRQECLDAGMNDYLSKPLNQRMLATMLEQWLPQAPVNLS